MISVTDRIFHRLYASDFDSLKKVFIYYHIAYLGIIHRNIGLYQSFAEFIAL